MVDKKRFRKEYLDFIDTVVNKRTSIGGIAVRIVKEALEIAKLHNESDVPIKTCAHSIRIVELVAELEKEALKLIKGVKKFEKENGLRVPAKKNKSKVKK